MDEEIESGQMKMLEGYVLVNIVCQFIIIILHIKRYIAKEGCVNIANYILFA